MYFIICALTSNWCEIPLYFFPHLNLRACQSKMALFQKTKYTICFISVSDANTCKGHKNWRKFLNIPFKKTYNILAWFEKVNKITFFSVYSKIAKKRIFLIFVDSDLNLCKASQVRTFSPRARASLHGSL